MTIVTVDSAVLLFNPARLIQAPARMWVIGSIGLRAGVSRVVAVSSHHACVCVDCQGLSLQSSTELRRSIEFATAMALSAWMDFCEVPLGPHAAYVCEVRGYLQARRNCAETTTRAAARMRRQFWSRASIGRTSVDRTYRVPRPVHAASCAQQSPTES